METFYVSVLPRTPRFDVDRLDLVFTQPLLNFSGAKLRAIVTANITWQQEQVALLVRTTTVSSEVITNM